MSTPITVFDSDSYSPISVDLEETLTPPSTPMEPTETKSTDDKTIDVPMDTDESKDLVQSCKNCTATIPDSTDKACRKCGYYIPSPGETFDTSKVYWKVPAAIAAAQIRVKSVDTPHDLPFPGGFGTGDTVNSPEANEWILNHMPLTEEQKKELMRLCAQDQGLHKELSKWDRDSKRRTETEGYRRSARGEEEEAPKIRRGVKGLERRHLKRSPSVYVPSKE